MWFGGMIEDWDESAGSEHDRNRGGLSILFIFVARKGDRSRRWLGDCPGLGGGSAIACSRYCKVPKKHHTIHALPHTAPEIGLKKAAEFTRTSFAKRKENDFKT
jgi:hypothetical protein